MRNTVTKKSIKIQVDAMLTRVVNECLRKKIEVLKVVYNKGKVNIDIHYCDYARFSELCLTNGWNMKGMTRYGIVNSLLLTFSRTGIVLGLIISIIAVIFAQQYTIDYRIIGYSGGQATAIVEEYLKDKTLEVDEKMYSELKKSLLAVPGIAGINVYKKGLYVFVEIKEELPTDSIIDEKVEKNITSNYDAIITRIITLSGTPLVSKDTRVKKGQILIDGYYIYQENKIECNAKGEVYGKVYLSEKHTVLKESTERKRTGKKEVFTLAMLAKENRQTSEILKKCSFSDYDVEIEESFLRGILPIKLRKITAYETQIQTNVADKKSLDGFAALILKQMEISIGDDGTLLDSYVRITDIGSAFTVDIFGEFEKRIA